MGQGSIEPCKSKEGDQDQINMSSDNMKTFTLSIEHSGLRADKALSLLIPERSRSELSPLFKNDKITLNGKIIVAREKVKTDDILTVELAPAKENRITGVEMPLDILYEDEHILVINKAAGVITHPGSNTPEKTVAHAILFHCGDDLRKVGEQNRNGIVHRLDKDTTGVLITAKTQKAYISLVKKFSNRSIEKYYLALVRGVPKLKSSTISLPIGRHPTSRTKMCILEEGKDARTDWKLNTIFNNNFSLIECQIHTGRTHQIRVHLSHLGFPIAGDRTYGYPKNAPIAFPRVMLHAHKTVLNHPVSNEPLILSANLPEEFDAFIKKHSE